MIRVIRDRERIKICFPYNSDYIAKIKTIEGYGWHPKEKCWSVPYSDGIIEKILSIFSEEEVEIDPSLYFKNLRRELSSRKYRPKTIKTYIHFNEDLLKFYGKNPDGITNSDVKDYLSYIVEQREVSTSTLNIAINALKFYYGEVLKQGFVYEIKRPKKDKKLLKFFYQ